LQVQVKKQSKKDQILRSAEELISAEGYINVSLRQIADQAGVQVSILNYHFSSKFNLLQEILRRRANVIADDRLTMLDEARIKNGSNNPDIKEIMHAFLWPVVDRCIKGEPGWRDYANIIAQFAYNQAAVELFSELFDPVARHFISAIRLSEPDLTDKQIHWRYIFAIGTMLQFISGTNRIGLLSGGKYSIEEFEFGYSELLSFVSTGIHSTG